MKILVLGATGMLGHMLFAELARKGFDVFASARRPLSHGLFLAERWRFGLDAVKMETVTAILDDVRPDVVINAVGLVRQIPQGKDPVSCLRVNALFPWLLREETQIRGTRLIHYSTDCVFNGMKGDFYTEDDSPSAEDFYGRSKSFGEVTGENVLTIRTSIIGPELRGKYSLLEWFRGAQEQVNGYTDAIYTGLPTSEHARILAKYVLPNSSLQGLYQVAATPISKFDLLKLINEEYELGRKIIPLAGRGEDKRLSGRAFSEATGYEAPAWPELLAAMHAVHEKNMLDFS